MCKFGYYPEIIENEGVKSVQCKVGIKMFKEYVQSKVEKLIEENKDNPAVLIFYFTLFYIAGAFLILPPSFIFVTTSMTFVAMWGPMKGAGIAVLHGVISCNIAFIIVFLSARYLIKDCVKNMTKDYQTFNILNRTVHTNGAKMVGLLRMTYVLPESLLTYVFATTEISLKDFVIGN